MNGKKTSLFERYLTKEIGIEFKACLYFYAVLFFYCVYKIAGGVLDAGILHMAEMILTCYVICYIQVYLFGNFDEADRFGGPEYAGILVCTLLYCLVSYFGGWFEKSLSVTLLFAAYLLFTYFCVFLVYKAKRRIDDKLLNEELRQFQNAHQKKESENEQGENTR